MSLNPIDQLEPVTIGATIAVFTTTYFVLRKTVFVPLVSVMQDRFERVEAGRRAAEEAHRIVEQAEATAAESERLARLEGERIARAAREKAERIRDERVAAAEAEAAGILEVGRTKIATARNAEVTALRTEAVDCVRLACDKLLVPIEPQTAEAIVDGVIAKRVH
jgi:F-type H+-transporting ATPase subunit b